MAILDPVFQITPGSDGIRRSSDPFGQLGFLVVSPGELTISGQVIPDIQPGDLTLAVDPGVLQFVGQQTDLHTRFQFTPGELTITGSSTTVPDSLILDLSQAYTLGEVYTNDWINSGDTDRIGTGIGIWEPSWREGPNQQLTDPAWPSIVVQNTTVYEGDRAFELTVPTNAGQTAGNAAQRADIRLTKGGLQFVNTPPATWNGQVVWIGFALRLDDNWPLPANDTTITVFWQLHGGAPGLSPSLALEARGSGTKFLAIQNEYQTDGVGGRGESTYRLASPYDDYTNDIGQWVRWVIRMKLARWQNNNGFVQVWKNDVQVLDQQNITNHPDDDLSWWTFSCYRPGASTPTDPEGKLHFDSIRMADEALGGNYATVNPASYI